MRSTRLLREARKRVLDATIRRASRLAPRHYVAFHQLLATVQARSTILSPQGASTDRSRRFLDVLIAVAMHRASWRRPLDRWAPPATSSHVLVLASLTAHLFALFPVPGFMNAAWTGTPEAQRWFIQLGAGQSVRALGLPVALNRRMAHAFRTAPDDLTILGALRWAQTRGLGGSPELARAIAKSRLGRESNADDEAFRTRIVALLVEHEAHVDLAVVPRLVDAFSERKRLPEGTDVPGDLTLCTLGPKTRDCILHEWGYRTPARPRPPGLSWNPAPFGGLRWYPWRIEELRTSEDLRQEGIAMRHCVATYASRCAFGGSSIWSLTIEQDGLVRRAVTIEVNVRRRQVAQIKGHANQRPKPVFIEVLRRWAKEQGLQMMFGGSDDEREV